MPSVVSTPAAFVRGSRTTKIDPRTGRLSLAAPVQNAYITNATLGGDHLGLLQLDKSNYEVMAAGVINPATGSVRFGSSLRLAIEDLYNRGFRYKPGRRRRHE